MITMCAIIRYLFMLGNVARAGMLIATVSVFYWRWQVGEVKRQERIYGVVIGQLQEGIRDLKGKRG